MPGLLRRRLPDRAARARAPRQARARGHRERAVGRRMSTGSTPTCSAAADALDRHDSPALTGAPLSDPAGRAPTPRPASTSRPGDRAVELMKAWVARATRPEVVGGPRRLRRAVRRLDVAKYREPLLATSTDGVGTKVAIAQAMDKHDTIGIDLVGMVVDDLVVCGAEPLFMPDYIACGKVVPERIAEIVSGIAEGCRQAGCALVGGETAEHPGLMGAGRVRRRRRRHRCRRGRPAARRRARPCGRRRHRDGLHGLHSNGYSLVRHVLLQAARLGRWTRTVPELGRTLGEELLEPDPDLRQGLPRADPGGRRCTPWRTSPAAGSPPTWPGCIPAGPAPRCRPRHLDAGPGLRPGRRPRPRRAGRDGAHLQHGRRDGRRSSRPRASRQRWRCSGAASRRGSSAR